MGGGISPHTTLPTSAAIQTTMEHEMAGIEPYYTEGAGLSQGYYVRLALLRMAEFSKRTLYSLVLRTTKNRAFDIIEKLNGLVREQIRAMQGQRQGCCQRLMLTKGPRS